LRQEPQDRSQPEAKEHHCGSVDGSRAEPKLSKILRARAGFLGADCLGLLVEMISGADRC
jgi:hypothetical protein